jgi:hypothetical protein
MNHMGIQWWFLFLDTADTVKKRKTLLGWNRLHHDRHTANMVEVKCLCVHPSLGTQYTLLLK